MKVPASLLILALLSTAAFAAKEEDKEAHPPATGQGALDASSPADVHAASATSAATSTPASSASASSASAATTGAAIHAAPAGTSTNSASPSGTGSGAKHTASVGTHGTNTHHNTSPNRSNGAVINAGWGLTGAAALGLVFTQLV